SPQQVLPGTPCILAAGVPAGLVAWGGSLATYRRTAAARGSILVAFAAAGKAGVNLLDLLPYHALGCFFLQPGNGLGHGHGSQVAFDPVPHADGALLLVAAADDQHV